MVDLWNLSAASVRLCPPRRVNKQAQKVESLKLLRNRWRQSALMLKIRFLLVGKWSLESRLGTEVTKAG